MFRYPIHTKLAGIVYIHRVENYGASLKSNLEKLEELCEDLTLKNVAIMVHQWGNVSDEAAAQLQSALSDPNGFVQAVVPRGAKIYCSTGTSGPSLSGSGALRIILEGRSVVPEVQQEPIKKGSKPEQTAARPVEPSKDKEVEELRRELEEQKGRAQQEAEVFKKRIAEMQSKEESTRKEMVREHYQELEEQKRRVQEEADAGFKERIAEMQSKEESIRQDISQELEEQKRKAQEEADELRKCIAELKSELEEDRHGSGKTSATYHLRHVPARSRVFLVGPRAHLALQRVYPSTDLRPNSPIGSMTHFTGRSMSDGCKTFRKMTWPGLLTIWIRHVTMSPFLTGRSNWPVGS